MAYIPDVTRKNRITIAIAALPERFVIGDVVGAADVTKSAASGIISQMTKIGWLEVVRIGQKGAKTWRKTAEYRPPSHSSHPKPPALSRSALFARAKDERDEQMLACMARLGAALNGWTPNGKKSFREAACA